MPRQHTDSLSQPNANLSITLNMNNSSTSLNSNAQTYSDYGTIKYNESEGVWGKALWSWLSNNFRYRTLKIVGRDEDSVKIIQCFAEQDDG